MALIFSEHLDASMGDNEAKEFSVWYTGDALQRIDHHLVPLKVIKGR
jgi:hypothetical protein